MKKTNETPRLPISVKAYDGFVARIHYTFENLPLTREKSYSEKSNSDKSDSKKLDSEKSKCSQACPSRLAGEAIGMLDKFLAGEEWLTPASSVEAIIAFGMIRVEVEKAMKRSSDARARAALRKAARASENQKAERTECGEEENTVTDPTSIDVEKLLKKLMGSTAGQSKTSSESTKKALKAAPPAEKVIADSEPTFVPRNRRERRAYERNLAKLMRKEYAKRMITS